MLDDIARIKARLRADYIAKAPIEQAQAHLSSLAGQASWPDIDYADTVRTAWPPLRHLVRLADICAAYQSPAHAFYRQPEVLATLLRGLAFWFERKPSSLNWWQNMIGQPQQLMRIMSLLENELPPDLFVTALGYLNDPRQVKASVATGQNLIWFASELLARGLFTANPNDIAVASQCLQSEIRTSTAEGIQLDYSFHQHGAQLYNGGYGLNFIVDGSYYADVLSGTPWAFAEEKLRLLCDYLLQGQAAMLRRSWQDFSVCGRVPARKNESQAALHLVGAAQRLSRCVPARAAALAALIEHIEGRGESAAYVGNRYFWRSEFMSHQRPAFYFSLRMASARLIGSEQINLENLKGCWLPFGLTYLLRRGDEYRDIWPLWDWARLPGVTAPDCVPAIEKPHVQAADFAGGVSDGNDGLAAMHMDKHDCRARKAWFCFDEAIVALGCAISSTRAEPVNTGINQCLQHGPVLVEGLPAAPGQCSLGAARWLWHDDIAYIFPPENRAAPQLKHGAQSGSWKSINDQYAAEQISADVMTLWLAHGAQPQQADYAYIIAAGLAAEAVAGYVADLPLRIVSNTPAVQAVSHANGITQIVFHQAGVLALDAAQSVHADQACLIMLRPLGDGSLQVSVADPRAAAGLLNIGLAGRYTASLHFALAGEALGGASQSQRVLPT